MINVISIDPGQTTGVVVGSVSNGKLVINRAFEVPWSDRFTFHTILMVSRPDIIIVEDFVLWKHQVEHQAGSRFPSCQVIGIVEAFAWELQLLNRIHYQPASQRMRAKILPEHLPILGTSPHTESAYKHLRSYLILNHVI